MTKWYEQEDVCPICGGEDDFHKPNCPNNTQIQPRVKKLKRESYGTN